MNEPSVVFIRGNISTPGLSARRRRSILNMTLKRMRRLGAESWLKQSYFSYDKTNIRLKQAYKGYTPQHPKYKCGCVMGHLAMTILPLSPTEAVSDLAANYTLNFGEYTKQVGEWDALRKFLSTMLIAKNLANKIIVTEESELIFSWNDNPDTKYEDVIKFLDEVAQL